MLYSAVVSRYHVEVRLTENQWEVVNLGTNGTYLDGKRVHQAPLETGSILRLARSGPNIQVLIGVDSQQKSSNQSLKTSPKEQLSALETQHGSSESAEAVPKQVEAARTPFYVSGRYRLFAADSAELPAPCDHLGVPDSAVICTKCGHPVSPIQKVGPFQGLRRLSASGNTLMAWRSGHTVVLKTLPSEYLRNAELVSQFENQCRQLCQLEHPSMPKVFEAFEAQGQPYLVSEMIYGPSLKDWVVQHGSVPQYQALRWMLELSRLLQYIHQQTPVFTHRRIMPANIIRPKVAHGSSQVVLVDFGEVKGVVAGTGTLPGSTTYTPSEQLDDQGSVESDLYALGATLVYLLTGKEPDTFFRLGDDTFQLHVKDLPNVSPEAASIIQRLTHPQPRQRFKSAADVINVLQSLL